MPMTDTPSSEQSSQVQRRVAGLKTRIKSLESGVKSLKESVENIMCIKEMVEKNLSLNMKLKELEETTNSSLNMKLKELKETNSSLNMTLKELKETNSSLEIQLKNKNKHMESEENKWEEKEQNLRERNKMLTNQKENLTKTSTEVKKNLQKEKEENAELLAGQTKMIEELADVTQRLNQMSTDLHLTKQNVPTSTGNHIVDSPLQQMVNHLPETMRNIIAPKGSITGDELGIFMGTFVNITAYTVTPANQNLKITAVTGFVTLLGVVVGTMFNNVVSYISTVEKAKLKPTAVKAVTSIPWVILGGVLPIAVGGFIHPWATRAIVTGVVAFLLKIIFASLWSFHYNIPKVHALCVVFFGVMGILLAAGAPDGLAWLGKKLGV